MFSELTPVELGSECNAGSANRQLGAGLAGEPHTPHLVSQIVLASERLGVDKANAK